MRPAALAATLLLIGCNDDPLGPDLRVVVAPSLTSAGSCSEAQDSTVTSTRLRLTARVHLPGDGGGELAAGGLCDTLIEDPGKLPTLALAFTPGTTLDLFAEAFEIGSGGFARTHSGSLLDIDPSSKTLPDLRLLAVEAFRCLPGVKLAQSRAFHTATPLSNGHILFVGGLTTSFVAGSDGPADEGEFYYATSSIEVFDPAARSMVSLVEVDEIAPPIRAFHQAIVLNDEAPYKVLLLGGISTKTPDQPIMRARADALPGRLMMLGTPTVAPTALVTYDPSAKTITLSSDPSNGGFQGAVFQAATRPSSGGVLAMGGWSCELSCTNNPAVDYSPDGRTVHAASIAPNLTLTGAALVPVTSTRALLLGGANTSTQLPFARVVLGSTAPETTFVEASSPAPLPLYQFVTVAPLPGSPSRVLIAGGLEYDSSDRAVQPPITAPLVVSDSGSGKIDVSVAIPDGWDVLCSSPNRYRSVAFNAATPIGDGSRVLLSGGTARTVACPSCESQDGIPDESLACALHQAAIYDANNNHLTRNGGAHAEPLQIARWGHSQTVLPDGTVLVAGGFTRQLRASTSKWETYGVRDFELYNPARRNSPTVQSGALSNDADDPALQDLFALGLSRSPGALARSTAKDPAIHCKQP